MNKMKYMKLLEGPAEIASMTRKAWGTLFETYGWGHFNAVEARGVIMNAHSMNTAEANRTLDGIVSRGFAEYTFEEISES